MSCASRVQAYIQPLFPGQKGVLSESGLGSNTVKKPLVYAQISCSPQCMLAAHGNVLGSGNEVCEGMPEFVWIMPKIHADCYKQNVCGPCTLKYMCQCTRYTLQQQYHPPIPWCGDCRSGDPKHTRTARSCGVISVTPSLAVVNLQSSARLPGRTPKPGQLPPGASRCTSADPRHPFRAHHLLGGHCGRNGGEKTCFLSFFLARLT